MAKKKIVILGGGMGGLAAALKLTSEPGWQERYDVTVHQLGWRLGGKGASGRNRDRGHRIEEHGVHVFFGAYENTFAVMRQVYEELGRPETAPLNSVFGGSSPAFRPLDVVTLMEQSGDDWKPWHLHVPRAGGTPGDGDTTQDPWELFCRLLGWLRVYARDRMEALGIRQPEPRDPRKDLPRRARKVVAERLAPDDSTAPANALELADDVGKQSPQPPDKATRKGLDQLLKEGQKDVEAKTRESAASSRDDGRHFLVLVRLAFVIARGMIRDGVVRRGFDAIDHLDLMEWLRKHGARDPELWSSPVVQALYAAAFAFDPADVNRPRFAAGTALRSLLRMFLTYKDAFAWKMQAGMGDAIFAPLYEVLRDRGVRFEFFHRVRNLELSRDGARRVESIEIGVQARVKDGKPYVPLYTFKDLPSWPSTPRYEQLEQGRELQEKGVDLESSWTEWVEHEETLTLTRRNDPEADEDDRLAFDEVILAIPLGSLRFVCRDLVRTDRRWARMVRRVRTIQTHALQIWLTKDAPGLGWDNGDALVSGFVKPHEVWSDTSQTLVHEDHPPGEKPASVSYFCDVLQDGDVIPDPFQDPCFPESQRERAYDEGGTFLKQTLRHLLPEASPNGDFDWNLLTAPSGVEGEDRLKHHYWRSNVNPSDRYVLSVPGSTTCRLAADESGIANLYLAGDWTRNGLNLGCIEATTMSGLQAARAVSGTDFPIPGETDDVVDRYPVLGWLWMAFDHIANWLGFFRSR